LTISPARRELQREYVNRMSMALLRPTPGGRVDARSYVRTQARTLLSRLEASTTKPSRNGKAAKASPDSETRAHLSDSIDTLRQAMTAVIQRQGL
jgi:hypothetical protein